MPGYENRQIKSEKLNSFDKIKYFYANVQSLTSKNKGAALLGSSGFDENRPVHENSADAVTSLDEACNADKFEYYTLMLMGYLTD